jgi:iron complex outermembrane recepter protein
MKQTKPNRRHWPALFIAICGGLFAAFSLQAQSAPGSIQGRVFNPVTQEYVRNAEVRLEGTNQVAFTENDGSFRFASVPAGQAAITVTYTGYQTVRESLSVSSGQVATREITLVSTEARTGEVIQLQAFTVSTEREGNAKAIMEQRRNMNITTSVASDIFGDVTDGNVGEFLKYLPGVDLDYVESETRGPRLGGMDAQYVGVSFDGVTLASADANRTGDLGRATSFEAFSISSIEAIEIHRTTSPDMDASSPAGTINMKTRRAFDRKGRRITYNTSVNMNSEEFHFKKTWGPDDRRNYKALPNWSFEYSDVFLDQRLGIVASYSHANSYTEQYRHNLTFNRNATAADPRPLVITQLDFKDGPKRILKDTYTLTADFKATPRLVLSNTLIYNFAEGEFYNRNLAFNAANNNANGHTGRSSSLGGLMEVHTNQIPGNTRPDVSIGGSSASKRTHTVTLAPRFEYKLDSWTIDGVAAYSRSFNNYEALEQGFARSESVNAIQSHWIATRPNIQSHKWTFQQVSGPDWFDLANFAHPRLTNEGRYAKTEIYSGSLNARWVTPLRQFPTAIKFGGKWHEESRNNGNETPYYTWAYIGPGGSTHTGYNATTGAPTFNVAGSSWAAYPSNFPFDTGTTGALTVINIHGQQGMVPRADRNAIAQLFKQHPEYFINAGNADNYYNAFVAPKRDIVQTVTAGYGMADVRLSSKAHVRTGIRWERTESVATEFDPLTNRELVAAGYAVNTAGRATSIEGVHHQFFTNPRVKRAKSYDDFFPMISAKYTITRQFEVHAGFNEAISRPPIDSLTGAWLINEDTQLVTSPNPNLLPEYSKNYAARLAYYFEPVGQLSLGFTQNNIRNLRETRRGTAEEFGVANDPEFSTFEFQSPFNVANPVRFRSMEVAYNQTLPFRHELLRGITVNTSYTRTYASQRRSRMQPHRVSSSLGYGYRAFRARLGIIWHDDTPWDNVYGRYKRHTTKFDLGAEYRINKWATVYVQGRNIFNDSQRWFESPEIEGQAGALRVMENYGANWVIGVKGTF